MKLTKHSKLFITKGLFLYIGTVMDTEFHNHHALQITFATDNDFIIDIEGESIRTKSILLNLKCRHKLIGRDGTQVLLLIEPESVYGKIFQTYLGNKPYQNLDFDRSERRRPCPRNT